MVALVHLRLVLLYFPMDLARIELASRQCECRVLPLNHRPKTELFKHDINQFTKIKNRGLATPVSFGR